MNQLTDMLLSFLLLSFFAAIISGQVQDPYGSGGLRTNSLSVSKNDDANLNHNVDVFAPTEDGQYVVLLYQGGVAGNFSI